MSELIKGLHASSVMYGRMRPIFLMLLKHVLTIVLQFFSIHVLIVRLKKTTKIIKVILCERQNLCKWLQLKCLNVLRRFFEKYAHFFLGFSLKLSICKTFLFRPYFLSDKQWLFHQLWKFQMYT
jgi:hypothetical protein